MKLQKIGILSLLLLVGGGQLMAMAQVAQPAAAPTANLVTANAVTATDKATASALQTHVDTFGKEVRAVFPKIEELAKSPDPSVITFLISVAPNLVAMVPAIYGIVNEINALVTANPTNGKAIARGIIQPFFSSQVFKDFKSDLVKLLEVAFPTIAKPVAGPLLDQLDQIPALLQ